MPSTIAEILTAHPYIRFRSNVPLARLIEAELGRMNVSLYDIAEMDTISAVTACVENGLGVSVVPRIAVRDRKVEVVMLPFGDPPILRQIGLLQRPRGPRATLIAELHAHLAEAGGDDGVHRTSPA